MLSVPVWTAAVRDPDVSSPSDILITRTVGDVCRDTLPLILATGTQWSIAVHDCNFASLEHYAWFAQIQHTNNVGFFGPLFRKNKNVMEQDLEAMLGHHIDNIITRCRYSSYRPNDLHIQKSMPRSPEVQVSPVSRFPVSRSRSRSRSDIFIRKIFSLVYHISSGTEEDIVQPLNSKP